SGEVDYTGGISKCDDRRVNTLLYEAALSRKEVEPNSRAERRPRKEADDGADSVGCGQLADCDFNRAALRQLTPSSATWYTENADTQQASTSLRNEPPPLTH